MVFKPNVVMLVVIMLSAIMLSIVMLSVVILSVIMLSVTKVNAITLCVVEPMSVYHKHCSINKLVCLKS